MTEDVFCDIIGLERISSDRGESLQWAMCVCNTDKQISGATTVATVVAPLIYLCMLYL